VSRKARVTTGDNSGVGKMNKITLNDVKKIKLKASIILVLLDHFPINVFSLFIVLHIACRALFKDHFVVYGETYLSC
jgi:hypothetical protein